MVRVIVAGLGDTRRITPCLARGRKAACETGQWWEAFWEFHWGVFLFVSGRLNLVNQQEHG